MVIAPEGDHSESPLAKYGHNQQCPKCICKQRQWSRQDGGQLQWLNYSNFSSDKMDNLTDVERKQCACSLSSKQMPSAASHLSRKKLKYRQRLTKRKKLGDMEMNAMASNVPSVEELMKRP